MFWLDFAINGLYLIFYGFAFVVSLWIGNFLTSFYFRIPRGITLNGRKMPPMCSNCGTRLKYPDYGPLYYYLIKSKCCKVCGIKIPSIYFYIELFTGIMLIANFYFNSINELSAISAFFIAAITLGFMLNYSYGQCYQLSSIMLLFCGIIRGVCISTHDEFLYDITASVSLGLAFAVLLDLFYKKALKSRIPHGYFFYFMAISSGIYWVDLALLLALSSAVFALGLLFCRLTPKDDILPHISKIINPACILSLFTIIYLLFFSHGINTDYMFASPFN